MYLEQNLIRETCGFSVSQELPQILGHSSLLIMSKQICYFSPSWAACIPSTSSRYIS